MAAVTRRTFSSDLLGFFLFLGFALHLMLILGLDFAPEDQTYLPPTLEVILVRQASVATPEQARFLAQTSQEGSGDPARRPTTPAAALPGAGLDRAGPASAIKQLTSARQRISAHAGRVIPADTPFLELQEPVPASSPNNLLKTQNLDQAIRRLEARLGQQQKVYAEDPGRQRNSARQAVEAAYLLRWRRQVESMGNRHYPAASSRYGIYGELRLLVAIRHDGSLEDIEILVPSGHAVLDEAAIRILHLAAPFEALPMELREQTERLEIIRTWKFQENRLSSQL
ncbi:MAG: TonB family protein [Halieaceae bacterium]|nr:TonB family protein [Halieaceae bacterium]